jgi:hypothetical protein
MQAATTTAQPLKNSDSTSQSNNINQAREALHAVENHTIRTIIQFSIITAIIIWGWMVKDEEYLIAESGAGYALGIIGGSMMLLLLLYPVRKKMKSGRYLGSVPAWFKFHMFCGVFGPIAILYHSNYSMGSLNGSIAMLCMIIVASSGLVGRYFYSKIHYGLYGQKASLDDLLKIIDGEEHQLSAAYKLIPDISDKLKSFQKDSVARLNFAQSFKRFIFLGFNIRLTSLLFPFKLKKAIIGHGEKAGWSKEQTDKNYVAIKKHINNFLDTVIKACEFSVYERLFSLWHLLHLPLFIMLVISGIVHVFAVHMY